MGEILIRSPGHIIAVPAEVMVFNPHQLSITSFTFSTNCFSENGFGRKAKSGYAEDAFEKNLEGQTDFAFLPKPFSLKQWVEKVKEVMES